METSNLPRGFNFKIPILIPRVPSMATISSYLEQIDSNRQYSNFGPLETTLRQRISKMWDVPVENVRTACNATLALQGAIETAEISSEDAWQVPSWTFAATALALKKSGVSFSFVDIDKESWRAIFSSDVRNVVDVLPFGDEIDFDRFKDFKIQNIVIDGAASFAALRNGIPKYTGKFGLVVSLHATKLLPAGEGAIFVSNCAEWSSRFKKWSSFGFDENRTSMLLGTNAKLSEFSAAIALAAMDDFDSTLNLVQTKQEHARQVTSKLGLRCHPALAKNIPTPYWIVEFASPSDKEKSEMILRNSGIQTRDWWGNGCHLNPIFTDIRLDLPKTEEISSKTIGLPMHTFLSDEDISFICDQLELSLSSSRL